MNFIITGGTGFLGSYIVSHFATVATSIKILGRNKHNLKGDLPEKVIFCETDYSIESLVDHMQGVDVVIHLASQLMQRDTDPLKISPFYSNISIVENLLLTANASGAKLFINTSSISAYNPIGTNTEDQFVVASNIYGLSKSMVDSYLLYFQRSTKMRLVSLRLARLFGHGERAGLMFTDFISKASAKEPLIIHGTGSASIEYVYVKDVVSLIRTIIESEQIQGIYNVGNEESYTIKEIADTVNEIFDNANNVIYLTEKPDAAVGTKMDHSKLKVELNWSPKWNLLESIQDIKMILTKENNNGQ